MVGFDTGSNAALSSLSRSQLALVIVALISVQFMYAGYHVFSKIAISDFGTSPFLVAFMRNVLAVPFLYVITFTTAGMPLVEPRDLMHLTFLALLGVVGNQSLLLLGLQYTSPISAALMQLLVPIIGTILAVIVKEESISCTRTGAGKVAGIIVAVVGAVVLIETDSAGIVSSSQTASNLLIGYLLYLGNSSCYAGFIVFMKPMLKKYPPSRVIFWTVAIGSIFMALVCFPIFKSGVQVWKGLSPVVWGCFAYCGVVASCLAFSVLSWANYRTSSVVTSAFSAVMPLATSLLSVTILHMEFRLKDVLGSVLLLIGLFTLCYSKHVESQKELQAFVIKGDKLDAAMLKDESESDDVFYFTRDSDFESAHSA